MKGVATVQRREWHGGGLNIINIIRDTNDSNDLSRSQHPPPVPSAVALVATPI